jgi:translation initiation factor IF-1
MKEKIEKFGELHNEINKYAKQQFKEFFKGKLKEGDKVLFEQWIITPDNKIKILYKINDERIPNFFIVES